MIEPAPPYRGEGPDALWHVSEDSSIARFEPHHQPGHALDDRLVWAIDTRHLPLYWFPRECRRATFWAHSGTSADDVERFLDGDRTRRVHVVETTRLGSMRTTRVVAYRLPAETFEPWDKFFVSRETVTPLELVELGDLLARAGFEVCAEARDGEEAVALARSEAPDLAIMDVKMPRLDGIEAARRILEERPIPIVMLTAYGQEELVSRAVEAGVFGYLVKPFREQDLLPAIAAARARHEELQAVREEAESLAEALAARKVIERAKGLLMEKEKLSEQDAFARLRRASQASGRPLKVIAEAVVATLGTTE